VKRSAALYDALRELERRVSKRSPFYMAKFVIGRPHFKNGRVEGWEDKHVSLGAEQWALYKTRALRPWKTIHKTRWPRDTRKSAMGQALMCCVLLDDPNFRWLIDSDTDTNAAKKMSVVKQVFEDRYFQELHGDRRGVPWNEEMITVKRTAMHSDPSVATSGLNAETTSQHYDGVNCDDLQTYGNRGEAQTMIVTDRFKLYESLVSRNGMVMVYGTPWGFKDLNWHIDQMKKEDLRYGRPLRVFSNDKSCFKELEDGSLDETRAEFPTTLDLQMISVKKASMDAFLFSCNYMCRPQSKETALFQKDQIQYHDRGAEDLHRLGYNFYLAIDPSKEGTWAGRDFDALVLAAVSQTADMFVVEALLLKLSREKLLREVLRLCEVYPFIKKVSIEKRFQQHELAAWLKKEKIELEQRGEIKPVRVPWHDLPSDRRSKDDRIRALSPYFESGKVWLKQSHTELEKQLLEYTPGSITNHDDGPDALGFILDMMDIPSMDKKEDWWKRKDWAEAYEAEKGTKEGMPRSTTIRVWQTVRRERERMRSGRGRRVRHLGIGL
jgi:predicted phage terminase large subunit-like protein